MKFLEWSNLDVDLYGCFLDSQRDKTLFNVALDRVKFYS